MDNNIEEKNVIKDISDLQSKLINIITQISEDKINIGKKDAWRDAGVAILNKLPSEVNGESELFDSYPVYVVTPFTDELSWMFYTLWDIFQEYLDSASKKEFIGRLAKAANSYLIVSRDNATLSGLLFITVAEAISIAKEIRNGNFQYLISSASIIYDDIYDLRSKIKGLLIKIQKDDIGKEDAWGGAGVIISDKPPTDNQKNAYPNTLYVVTPFVEELSWLFNHLWWDIFNIYYDYMSKYEFFERLANTANNFITSSGANTTARGLLIATTSEAISMAEEIQRRYF